MNVIFPSVPAVLVSIVMLSPNVTGALTSKLPAIEILLLKVTAGPLIVKPVRFVPPPSTPPKVKVPVPDVRDSVVPPSTVPEKTTLPAVAPEVITTPPLSPSNRETLSENVIVPPAPAVPVPSLAPPVVSTEVSVKTIVSPLVFNVTAPPAPPLPSLLLAAALPVVLRSAPVKIVIVPAVVPSTPAVMSIAPPALPAAVAVPPEVVMFPFISISPSVAAAKDVDLTAVFIVTAPPSAALPPVVMISLPESRRKDPAA